MNSALQVLIDRGFVKQCTDFEALSDLMDKESVKFYLGVDPTGRSIHIGHMVPFFAMHHMQNAGHRPVALVGGGTAMIGDPSGKTEMRKMLSVEEIRSNSAALKEQLGTVVDFSEQPEPPKGKAIMLNNYDWLGTLNYIEFLRDIGRHFSVNRMLTFESYKQRLERGLSFIEFNYQLLQSFDYLTLYRNEQCRLQIGGDDQWGNIVAGIELIRRIEGSECFGLTFNLITRSDGQKMGKSEKGAVFLDPELFSPYDFFQYWRNVNDEDVIKFMKLFTFLSLEEIEGYDKATININETKERLAYEQTKIIHGELEAEKALQAAKAVFSAGMPVAKEGLPSIELDKAKLDEGIGALELFSMTELCKTNSDARRLVEQGGATINEQKITDIKQVIDSKWIQDGELLLKAGKKRYFRITVK
ncbi:MAG: tyrosine--tRNA ligase [Sphaerochaetaceae bacterium]|jgi:tyrosyl-tRNA synthetase|nr:tyrosine--tRNA ligase [Sphaerochaetaceae bacterium]MDD4841975.1 tyrosine--tRNA ligase [Sphaerochaetaceae bacterium]MDD5076276.1 tyrosine--tRNA ligase [Sphaerochaetaceae bacterium]MDX9934065.1 tyrosine--tRNA ligase [Sphaerochaetaceae bacterium]